MRFTETELISTGHSMSSSVSKLHNGWPQSCHFKRAYFRLFVSICLDATMFGTAVVFLLLAAKNIETFLHTYGGVHVGFCYLAAAVGAFMLPITLLKSPKDFWFVQTPRDFYAYRPKTVAIVWVVKLA